MRTNLGLRVFVARDPFVVASLAAIAPYLNFRHGAHISLKRIYVK